MNRQILWIPLTLAGALLVATPAHALFLGDVFGGGKPAKPNVNFCKSDEFEKVCHVMDRLGGQSCPEPNPLSTKSASAIAEFVKRAELMLKKAAAAQVIRAKYMPCLSEEARREHRVDCAVYVKEKNMVTCEGAPASYRKAWEDGVRGAEKALVERAIEKAPSRPGRSVETYRTRELARAQKVIAAIQAALQKPEFAVVGVDFSQVEAKVKADFAAKDAEWAKAAGDAAKDRTEKAETAAKEKTARQSANDAKELEDAKSVKLPKARMKNATLAKKAGRLVEKRWPGEKALKVVLSSKRWEVVRNKWTGIITGRVMDFHLVVQQPSGRCRLFLYGLHQPKEDSGYGTTTLNGVGESHRVVCESFGAVEGQKPAVGGDEG